MNGNEEGVSPVLPREVRESSSFRDPSGFVFYRDGQIFRQVNRSYQENFEIFKSSGLRDELTDKALLVPFVEVDPGQSGAIAVLKPEIISFISHPFEWSFTQLKHAAVLTLEIQEAALRHGMVLKDASAFNVQFRNGAPIFIDTLSFDVYREGEPWIAYRQFCRHFLAPLALMSYVDVRLGSLTAKNVDGVPLDLASKLLPGMTKFKPGLLSHIHLHAKAESHKAGSDGKVGTVSKTALAALVDSLKGTVSSLEWSPGGTEWSDYYEDNNYSGSGMEAKRELVSEAIDLVGSPGDSCWDLGANTGEFSRIAASKGLRTISWDVDPSAVEKNYLRVRKDGETLLLPLLQDLTNPSAGFGWMGAERSGLIERGPADVVLALALIHHLAIGNNVPLAMVAELLSRVGRNVIVEFVPKEDSQVKRMLSHREDIFNSYDLDSFRAVLSDRFSILAERPIPGTVRTLFVLRTRG